MPEPVLPKGQEYGERTRMEQAQQAQPVAGSPSSQITPMSGGMPPGSIPSLEDPTALPDDPLQSGLPGGPGAGPEALMGTGGQGPEELALMQALARRYPLQSFMDLIQWTETNMATPMPIDPHVMPQQMPELIDTNADETMDADLMSEVYMDTVDSSMAPSTEIGAEEAMAEMQATSPTAGAPTEGMS